MNRTILCLVSAVCAWFLTAQVGHAGPMAEPAQDKVSQKREIDRRLELPVNVEFKDATLNQIIDDLRVLSGLTIVIDQPALDKDGYDNARPSFTLKVEGVALKSAINLVLYRTNLTYVIKDDVVMVTTKASPRLVQQVYPVADLVMTPEEEGEGEGCKSAESRDSLIRLFTNTIAPQSWADVSGPGTIEYLPEANALMIVQTPDVQEQVRELLDALRRLETADLLRRHLPYLPRETVRRQETIQAIQFWGGGFFH